MKYLFVCLGNICRSPVVAATFQHEVKASRREGDFVIDSCGIGGWHAGDMADPRSIKMAQSYGISLEAHRARKIRKTDFAEFDVILCMDESNLAELQQICPKEYLPKVRLLLEYALSENRPVPDPYYSGEDAFRNVQELALGAAKAMLAKV